MSGPKHYDYNPIIHHTFTTDGGNCVERAEVIKILRETSGISVGVRNGQIVIDFTNNSGWTYSDIQRIVAKAKEKARENLEYVKEEAKNQLLEINRLAEKRKQINQETLANIDASILELKKTRQKIGTTFSTPTRTFSPDKELEKIDKEISSLQKEREKEIRDFESDKNALSSYESALKKVQTPEDLSNAISERPTISSRAYNPAERINTLTSELEKKHRILGEFCDAVNKLYAFLEKQNLTQYTQRLDAKVKDIDPYDVKSIQELTELVKSIVEEQKFRVQQEINEKQAEATKGEFREQLVILKEISESLKPITFELDKEIVETEDVSSNNKANINKIEEAISEISGLEYVSPPVLSELKSIKQELDGYKRGNLSNPAYSALISQIAKKVDIILQKAKQEEEKFKEYHEALKEYQEVRSMLVDSDDEEGISKLTDFSKITFTMQKADELISGLKKDTEEMKKVLQKIMNKAFVNSIGAVVGPDKVLCKEEDQGSGKSSFSFVREDAPGAIFVVEESNSGARISPKGVVLSSGQAMIDGDGLRKVHDSCRWSEEMNEKLTAAGMPPFTATEQSEEIKEALYEEENFVHLNVEESIRYLQLLGYSDEEILNEFGYDVLSGEFVDTNKSSQRKQNAATSTKKKYAD